MKTESLEESLKAIQDGRLEVAIIGAREAGIYVNQQIWLDFRPVLETAGLSNTVGVKNGNIALVDEINQALAEIKTDGSH